MQTRTVIFRGAKNALGLSSRTGPLSRRLLDFPPIADRLEVHHKFYTLWCKNQNILIPSEHCLNNGRLRHVSEPIRRTKGSLYRRDATVLVGYQKQRLPWHVRTEPRQQPRQPPSRGEDGGDEAGTFTRRWIRTESCALRVRAAPRRFEPCPPAQGISRRATTTTTKGQLCR